MTTPSLSMRIGCLTTILLLAPSLALETGAQEPVASVARLRSIPESLTLTMGDSARVRVEALNASGAAVEVPIQLLSLARREVGIAEGGIVRAIGPAGEYRIAAVVQGADSPENAIRLEIPVTIEWPPVTRVEITSDPGALFVGTALRHHARGLHPDGSERPSPRVNWRSSDPSVARVNLFGEVEGVAPGEATITATIEGSSATLRREVRAFPNGASLSVSGGPEEARTGDVVTFEAAFAGAGASASEIPVSWGFTFTPDDSIHAPGAPAILQSGTFVAEVPGVYSIFATAGPLTARHALRVTPREAVQRVEMVGQGAVRHVHTSDLWVFEGLDGRDYAITGTWGADGVAYFWDVTDPAHIVKVDSIQVDARTVNDVKVSPDGRYAALSREGASNRRNGVVILDLADPASPKVASTFDDGLTGGVHNMFATNEHLFALSGGDKYMILDVRDIYAPRYVSEYNHPDSRIHDVWVEDGIAYSSEWENGVVIVDVGNGRWGGTIEKPVFVTNIPYPVGRTHAAFPYHQESTGRFYLFLGDEILSRRGASYEGYGGDNPYDPETGEGGVQSPTSGYIHVIDWTDPENPIDVARYEVPEAGTHNLWVEDDKLYVAYYEGGLRVVDISGELRGDLYDQGREIAAFRAFDPIGFLANSPQAWGPQPFKGHIFFSDFNSGLWAVRLMPPGRPIS